MNLLHLPVALNSIQMWRFTMKHYDVIIIGAGPGGIFSAYELTRLCSDLKVAIFETGAPLEKRKCPIDGDKVKTCIH